MLLTEEQTMISDMAKNFAMSDPRLEVFVLARITVAITEVLLGYQFDYRAIGLI